MYPWANMEAAFCHVNYVNVKRSVGVFFLSVYHDFCPLFFDKFMQAL